MTPGNLPRPISARLAALRIDAAEMDTRERLTPSRAGIRAAMTGPVPLPKRARHRAA